MVHLLMGERRGLNPRVVDSQSTALIHLATSALTPERVESLASTIDTDCLAKLQRQRASSKHLLLSYPNEKQQAPQQKRSEPLSEKAILAEQSIGVSDVLRMFERIPLSVKCPSFSKSSFSLLALERLQGIVDLFLQTLFSDDVPWTEGAAILFLSSIVLIRTSGLVRFLLLSTLFSVFVRDHVGQKGGPPSSPFRPIIDRDFTNAEGSLLTKPPTLEASRQKEATRAVYEAPPPVVVVLGSAPVQRLMGKVGLQGFLNYEARTYEHYTLEFLSTLTKGGDEEGPFITFHLDDEEQKMYYNEVMEAFGWDYVADDDFIAPGVFNEAIFYGHITNGLVWHARCKSSTIPHPALLFVHRLLAMTLFCHGEPTHLLRFDLKCLWAMTPEGVGCPDWVDIFVTNCLELARKEKGKISMGEMVTLLANYLDIGVLTDDEANSLLQHLGTIEDRYLHTRPSNVYNFEQLMRASMLWIAPQETSMAQLYLTPDEKYQAGVEEELGTAPPQ
ncbi:Beta-galactosidase [Bienertia sinuspersici]